MSLSRNTKPSTVVKVLSVTECSNIENISEYLKQQGVTACKRFTIKKDRNLIETNTLLLTFNSTSLPKSLLAGLGGSVGCAVRLETRRSRVQPPPRSATFIEIDHEIFSTIILSLPLIQEGQLSVAVKECAHYWLTA